MHEIPRSRGRKRDLRLRDPKIARRLINISRAFVATVAVGIMQQALASRSGWCGRPGSTRS
jgi:hypothetical protein